MSLSQIKYLSTGVASIFPVPFQYLAKEDVRVYLNGVLTADYTWLTGSSIRLPAIPPAGTVIDIRRDSPKVSRIVNFQDGSILTERDLDTDSDQVFFLAQEAYDRAGETLSRDPSGRFNAQDARIINVGDAVAPGDAVNVRTLQYQYPDVVAVGAHMADIQAIASDLTANGVSIQDLGSVLDPLSGAPTGTSYLAAIGANLATLLPVGQNIAEVLAADDNAAAAAASASIAAGSVTQAAASATSADASKTAAATSASGAAASATSAQAASSAAATSATNAASSATSATDSATAAASSATSAATSATNAASSATSASNSAAAATSSASAASGSAASAASSATLASAWAEKTDGPVSGTAYSAKYWAGQAYNYAGGGVASFNTRTGAVVLTAADISGALGYTPLTDAAGGVGSANLAATLDLGGIA